MEIPARRVVAARSVAIDLLACLLVMVIALVIAGPKASPANATSGFEAKVARLQSELNRNPKRLPEAALESCMASLQHAVGLYYSRQQVRAERSLRYCFTVLGIPEEGAKVATSSPGEALRTRAQKEMARALSLEPDVERGLEIYRSCAACHSPEGWGYASGMVPQIAGQHRQVVIKQLADMRAGHRANVLMEGYPTSEALKDAQALADVAAYVDSLEISTANGKGPGDALEAGGRIYAERCADCHGASGEGDADQAVPRIQSQHFEYLVRQLEWIRSGQRENGHPEMKRRIADLDDVQTRAVIDYVSRLEPPPELRAPPGWNNPDFSRQAATPGEKNPDAHASAGEPSWP